MPHRLSGHAALDSLSNLTASLNAGKDKQAGDAFFIPALARDQIESLYRGDWLARKIVDIVPYDCVREWRAWAGEAGAVARVKAIESRLTLRRAVQRAMVMGRLYGGGALLIGTRESDPAALASELRPEAVGADGIAFLHPVSRWQLAVAETERDPLSPWYGEPKAYEVTAPERGTLVLHPSRVIRFLGAPLADLGLAGADLWSDSVLTALYDAIHAVALTTTGATSLMHEAKVDVVTVPNLSEHLSNAATTAQLSARFGYAAAMKSMNNLLLLGDGETWARQRVDFAGLPEMVRTFLQIAAGAADIPVTRLLGQPAEDGTDITAAAMPSGGGGIRGWLSAIHTLLLKGGPNAPRVMNTGNLSAINDAVVLGVDGYNTAVVQLATGGWGGGPVMFEGSADNGASWTAVNMILYAGGAPTSSTASGGLWEMACGGLTHLRVRATATITSGPVGATLAATNGLKSIRVGNPAGNPLVTTPGKTTTAGDASVAAGGTAQMLFAGVTPANGWKVANPDPAEDLWVSDSASAAPNGTGSYRVPAGGILTTEPLERPCGPVSVYGATTGHAITARAW